LDYRALSVEQANEIQTFARSVLPSFLRERLWQLTEPETASSDVINLADFRLTEEDRGIIDAAMLAYQEQKPA
jgi:hypothetical protein